MTSKKEFEYAEIVDLLDRISNGEIEILSIQKRDLRDNRVKYSFTVQKTEISKAPRKEKFPVPPTGLPNMAKIIGIGKC